jgi:hypothetical protein
MDAERLERPPTSVDFAQSHKTRATLAVSVLRPASAIPDAERMKWGQDESVEGPAVAARSIGSAASSSDPPSHADPTEAADTAGAVYTVAFDGPLRLMIEFDAELLSDAVATALAKVVNTAPIAPRTRVDSVADSAPKRSFWAGAWHADVVLSSIAILVVVVVLLAWTV